MEEDAEGRAIVFVKTRDLAHALQSVLLRHPVLKALRPCVLTSANTSSTSGQLCHLSLSRCQMGGGGRLRRADGG